MERKRERIEAIKDEVKELHPLLENVLPRLPNVKSYEYTHGQFERGADFIVEVENATTGRRSFVGVVVKAGKINAGKIAEVSEQVLECSEERAYTVKNRVRCTEVWIFASGGYSERAKEKIQERFPGRSVEFFASADIAKFVDEHYGYFWDDIPNELGAYFQQLQTRIDVLDKSTQLLVNPAAGGFYIELDTFERIKKNYSQTKSNPEIRNVDLAKELIDTKLSLLEAEMGFGKSRLVRRIVSFLSNAVSFKKNNVLPVFSSYKAFVDNHGASLDSLVKSHLGAAFKCIEHDHNVRILVVLDGIDECSSVERTSSELFEQLVSEVATSDRYRVVVTTRPLKSFNDKASIYESARTFGIRPLSLTKIVKYLELTCAKQSLPKKLFEDLKKSPLFKQLPQSPIAAALFSNLLAQTQQEVPQSLTELYAKSMELMLGRWEQQKELATEKQFTTAQLIAEQLACYFVDNRLIYCSKDEVDEMVRKYLKSRNVGVSQDAINGLLFGRSNIFSSDDESGTVAFRHRSFAEYLSARRKAKNRSLSVAEAALDPYWTNVFFFYVGSILDCPEVLVELREIKAKTEIEEWMKLISLPSYLLAAYQTEFDEVEENIMVALLDTARLYLRVRRGDTYTKLTSLSEMKLLYLFKSLVTDSFGYDFFSRSFETLAIRIDEALDDEEVKAYALFFLSCADLDCGSETGFRYMLTKKGANSFPLPVSLAIRCELESSTHIENKKLLKDHRDKLRRLLLGGGKASGPSRLAVQAKLDELFSKPMATRNAPAKLLEKSQNSS